MSGSLFTPTAPGFVPATIDNGYGYPPVAVPPWNLPAVAKPVDSGLSADKVAGIVATAFGANTPETCNF